MCIIYFFRPNVFIYNARSWDTVYLNAIHVCIVVQIQLVFHRYRGSDLNDIAISWTVQLCRIVVHWCSYDLHSISCMMLKKWYIVLIYSIQSGRSPKVVAVFSATNISSNIVWLLQLHDTIQMKSNYTWINFTHIRYSHKKSYNDI